MSAYIDVPKMPSWLRKDIPKGSAIKELSRYLRAHSLETVCANSRCPNISECYSEGNVSFLILGNVCTRDCLFCAIHSGRPGDINGGEPQVIADAVHGLNLKYVVVTSVARDDIADGGSGHYASVVMAVKAASPRTLVETLVPDFNGSKIAVKKIIESGVDVFSHNIETVARLYPQARPDFDYRRSLDVLQYAASFDNAAVKSGFMVGLGET